MPVKRDRRRARAALHNAGTMAAARERERHEALGGLLEQQRVAEDFIWRLHMALFWDNVAIVALSQERGRMRVGIEPRIDPFQVE